MEGERMLRQRLGRPALWLAGLSIAALGLGVAEPAVASSDKGSISGTITLDPALAGSTLDAPPAEVGDGRPEWWESTLSSLDAAERPPQDPRRSSAPIKAAPGDALRGDGDD